MCQFLNWTFKVGKSRRGVGTGKSSFGEGTAKVQTVKSKVNRPGKSSFGEGTAKVQTDA